MITWLGVHQAASSSAASAAGPGDELGQRRLGDEQRRGADRRRPRRRRSTGITSDPGRLRNDSPALASASVQQHERAGGRRPSRSSSASGLLGRRRVERAGVEDGQRLALGVDRQRAAQRGAARLAVDLDGVVARLRAEHDAAAGPDAASASEPGAGAAGALLAPRLGAAAARPRRGSWSTCVPCRRALSSARTVSCTSGMLKLGLERVGVQRARCRRRAWARS